MKGIQVVGVRNTFGKDFEIRVGQKKWFMIAQGDYNPQKLLVSKFYELLVCSLKNYMIRNTPLGTPGLLSQKLYDPEHPTCPTFPRKESPLLR